MPISAKDLQAALPDLESTQCCAGLEKTVTIHRDPWGIPHIQAAGEAALFFAQGFVSRPKTACGIWTSTAIRR